MPVLADVSISGEGFIKTALILFAVICAGLIVWGLGRYFFPKLKAPPVVLTAWDGIFVLIAALVVLNFLAGMIGHPFIRW